MYPISTSQSATRMVARLAAEEQQALNEVGARLGADAAKARALEEQATLAAIASRRQAAWVQAGAVFAGASLDVAGVALSFSDHDDWAKLAPLGAPVGRVITQGIGAVDGSAGTGRAEDQAQRSASYWADVRTTADDLRRLLEGQAVALGRSVLEATRAR